MRRQQQHDLERGLGRVVLPNALDHKYPNAGREWAWQWVFPASKYYVDLVTGERYRHHLHESVLQKTVHDYDLYSCFERGWTWRQQPC